jgi:hypothetical protein
MYLVMPMGVFVASYPADLSIPGNRIGLPSA